MIFELWANNSHLAKVIIWLCGIPHTTPRKFELPKPNKQCLHYFVLMMDVIKKILISTLSHDVINYGKGTVN